MTSEPRDNSTSIARIAAVGDLHCTAKSSGAIGTLFTGLEDVADVLALCGDLTDYGRTEEARILVRELAGIRLPIVAVLGNHDFESGVEDEIAAILREAGVTVLDGEAHEVAGVGFAGTKGFGGGFGRHSLDSWGEPAIKAFVKEAIDECLKLESGLSRLRTPSRVVLLHYSPIRATVEGEPVEILPWLGSSRLEEALNRYEPTVVFHGHAHRGQAAGVTQGGIQVYNVSLPLLRQELNEQAPLVRVVEVPRS